MMGNISNISLTLYKSLGLPAPKPGQKLRADHNELTQKVDGNIEENGKNGFVETEELYEEVFSNRGKYRPVIKKLYEAGLEDPFEERPEIKAYVKKLFKKYGPVDDIQKTIIIFSAIIPPELTFLVETTSRSPFARILRTLDQIHKGLSIEKGGLGISYNSDYRSPLREKFGNPRPKELINARAELRVSKCIGSDNLLIVFLRAAGTEANIKGDYNNGLTHAYVIAMLDNRRYLLDPAKLMFTRTGEKGDSDREGISFHYLREAYILSLQGKYTKAASAYEFSHEINSKINTASFWYNYGVALAKQGKNKSNQALEAFSRALKIDPKLIRAWHNRGFILRKQGKLKEAAEAFEREKVLKKLSLKNK